MIKIEPVTCLFQDQCWSSLEVCLYAKARLNRYVFTSEEAAITTTIVRDVLTGYPSRDTCTRRTFCDHKCLWSPCQTLSFTVVTFFSNVKFFAWCLIKQQATSSPQQTICAVFRFVEKVVTTAPWWWHGPHDESRSTRKDSYRRHCSSNCSLILQSLYTCSSNII